MPVAADASHACLQIWKSAPTDVGGYAGSWEARSGAFGPCVKVVTLRRYRGRGEQKRGFCKMFGLGNMRGSYLEALKPKLARIGPMNPSGKLKHQSSRFKGISKLKAPKAVQAHKLLRMDRGVRS